MNRISYKLTGQVWIYQGYTPWHFVTIKKQKVDEIKKDVLFYGGFKSIKVKVKIGKTQWQTSIFPNKNGSYILPIKKSVRQLESIKDGNKIKFTLSVMNT